jgi:hypothetical protein
MESIIKTIDAEIAKLQKARTVLAELQNGEHKPGKPSASKLQLVAKKRHRMSAEGRKRISDAAKARWKKHKAEAKQLAKAG